MALHNRDYMGGAAPPPGSAQVGFSSPLRAYRVLIALNVILFLVGKSELGQAFLLKHAVVTNASLAEGRYWMFLLAGFFHADVIHLALTSWAVYVLGWRIEQRHGPTLLVTLYLLGTLAVGGASLAVNNSKAQTFPWAKERVSTGSGFFVAKGLLVTNAHVVGDSPTVEIELADSPEGKDVKKEGKVRSRNPALDLALVEVDLERPVLPMAPQRPAVGSPVFAYGYGSLEGDTKTQLLTRGIVSGFRNDKQWLVFDGKVNPGNSGGALVDSAGRWLGVVVAKSRPAPGEDSLGFAVEGQAVASWLMSQGVQIETSDAKPEGQSPPKTGVGGSVVRLVVKQASAVDLEALEKLFSFSVMAMDPLFFGASGAFFAMAAFFCYSDPRHDILIVGNPVPFIVVIGLVGVVDLAGALRTYHNFYSWGHLYHLSAGVIGALAYLVYKGKLRTWLEARRQAKARAKFTVHEGGASERPKLSLADRARLDRLLEKVSRTGLDSLSAEERAFLDEASGKLRGE